MLGCFDRNGNIIDFYTIFNVSRTAEAAEIKTAFHALIKRYHPDTSSMKSDNLTDKLDLIIRGYRILIDMDQRIEYDRLLHGSGTSDARGYPIISKKRIKYSGTLGDMLKARFLPKRMNRNDILLNFGQDIEIFVTPLEALKGAVAYIDLPARMTCPLCRGSHAKVRSGCHVCGGVGRIHTTSQLEVKIPPHVDDSTYIDVDLVKIRPDKLTSFNLRSLRIKITVKD
jgi:DnaJ-class molecular chaperone